MLGLDQKHRILDMLETVVEAHPQQSVVQALLEVTLGKDGWIENLYGFDDERLEVALVQWLEQYFLEDE